MKVNEDGKCGITNQEIYTNSLLNTEYNQVVDMVEYANIPLKILT